MGDNTFSDSAFPVTVAGVQGAATFGDVTGVAAGVDFSLALRADGTVWAWGHNEYGQLGIPTSTADITAPVQVEGPGGVGYLTGITAITASDWSAFALKSDGTVWAWGYNGDGQLGDNSTSDSNFPVEVLDSSGSSHLSGITSIAAGSSLTMALDSEETVWAWGSNVSGQVGNGQLIYGCPTPRSVLTPSHVVGPSGSGVLSGITAIAAGASDGLALDSNKVVWAWGDNTYGELGTGAAAGCGIPTPEEVQGPGGVGNLSNVVSLAAGNEFSLAVTGDGSVWS